MARIPKAPQMWMCLDWPTAESSITVSPAFNGAEREQHFPEPPRRRAVPGSVGSFSEVAR